MQEVQGVTGKPKFALAALLIFLLFAGFFATAERARADSGSPDPSTAGEVAAPPSQDPSGTQQNTAGEVAVPPSQDPAPPSQNPSTQQQTTDQQSLTDQVANAAATAVQPQQSNVVIIIRVNSPGDDVVTQTNIVSVVAVGANQSSTSQNSGLPGPPPAGNDANAGLSDPPGTDGQPADGEPTEGQAAPSPGAAPQRSQPAQAAAPAPTSAQQPVEQPTEATAAPQRPDASAILATSAENRAAPEGQNGSPTKSATPLRRGGARGRSDASASRTTVGMQARGGFAANSTPTGKAGSEATSTKLHAAKTATIAAKDAPGSWLNRARLAAPEQIAANDKGSDTNLGLTTLTALLLGLIGWRVMTWFSARGSPWRRAGG
jgi:hypothetical protein